MFTFSQTRLVLPASFVFSRQSLWSLRSPHPPFSLGGLSIRRLRSVTDTSSGNSCSRTPSRTATTLAADVSARHLWWTPLKICQKGQLKNFFTSKKDNHFSFFWRISLRVKRKIFMAKVFTEFVIILELTDNIKFNTDLFAKSQWEVSQLNQSISHTNQSPMWNTLGDLVNRTCSLGLKHSRFTFINDQSQL